MDTDSRKVQKMGLSSLGISLPKAWTSALGLEAGTVLQLVREEDGSVRIEPPGRAPSDVSACRVRAEACEDPRTLERVVIGNYLLGRDTVQVVSRTPLAEDVLGEVYSAVDKLTGMTIVEQEDRSIVLESFVEPTKFPVRGLLRRLQYLAERMIKLSLEGITKPDEGVPADLLRLEEETDGLYWLITRQLRVAARDRTAGSQIGETDPWHIAGDVLVAAMLERVADVALDLLERRRAVALELSGFPEKISTRFFALGEQVQDVARGALDAFFRGDVAAASRVLETIQEAEEEAHRLAATIPMAADIDAQYCVLCLQLKTALQSLAHMAVYYGTIAHVALNRALEGDTRVCEALPT